MLLYPLQMHKGAREQCIAVICDKKSFEELENGYKSDNQCDDGAKLVDQTVALLSSKGITGTPTYIFPDGRFQSGVLEIEPLRQRLGNPAAPGTAAPAKKAPPAPAKK